MAENYNDRFFVVIIYSPSKASGKLSVKKSFELDYWTERCYKLTREEALNACDRAIAINPNDSITWYNRGVALDNLARYSEAIASYDQAIAVDSNYKDAWYNKGVILENLEKYPEAIASYERTIAIDPNYKDAWNNKCSSLIEMKSYQNAITSCVRAIDLDFNHVYAWYNRGLALRNLEFYDDAIKSYDQAIAIDPSYQDAWNNRGVVFYNLEKYSEAIASYDRVIAINPNYTDAWYNKGLALNSLAKYLEAIASYDRTVAINPNDKEAWHERGLSLSNLKRYPEAIKSYNRAIAIDSNYKHAWLLRGFTFVLVENFQEAEKSFAKISNNETDLTLLAKTIANLKPRDSYQTSSDIQMTMTKANESSDVSIQTKTIATSDDKLRSEIVITNSDQQPKKLTLIANSNKYWIYNPDLNQYVVNNKDNSQQLENISLYLGLKTHALSFVKMFKSSPASIFSDLGVFLVSSNDDLIKDSDIKNFEHSLETIDNIVYHSYNYEFTQNKEIFQVNILVNPDRAIIEQITFQGKVGDKEIVITEKITQQAKNPFIEADTFTFSPPTQAIMVDSLKPLIQLPAFVIKALY